MMEEEQDSILEQVTAGVSKMTKEELENMKENIKKIDDGDGELSEDELEGVISGIPYFEAQERFERAMGGK